MQNRFALARECRGLSADTLARQLGVSPSALSAWDSGEAYPTLDEFVRLVNIIHFPADFLLVREP